MGYAASGVPLVRGRLGANDGGVEGNETRPRGNAGTVRIATRERLPNHSALDGPQWQQQRWAGRRVAARPFLGRITYRADAPIYGQACDLGQSPRARDSIRRSPDKC